MNPNNAAPPNESRLSCTSVASFRSSPFQTTQNPKNRTGQASSSLSRFRDLLPSKHGRPKRKRLGDQCI
jgi:hypothetical protein